MRSAFRNKLTAFAAVCGLAALTAACDGVVVVSQVYSTQSQLDNNVGSFSYFATMTPIAVYVRGSPFANDPNNEGVAAALQRTSSIPNLRFVGAATPPTTGYVVVMARGQFLPNVN